ncbi:lipopolysaccharide biosynthesis protein [Pedobacter gandavensis]|uniref:lipopolysaccharide biosynthesis protein n=1 Tax=Pedobacter gandavensis TaxID=2679963 RepID=UPI002931382B|nr:lipopolysaccharide biosynthesis protein [Pedobacter gandavensis]
MDSENQKNIGNGADEISMKDVVFKAKALFSYLLSKSLIIICFVIIGSVLGVLYSMSKKMMYTATTTFVLEEAAGGGGGGLGAYAGLASIAGIDLGGAGGGIFQGDNILELYRSRKMIQKTLLTEVQNQQKKELLIDMYIDFTGRRELWQENAALKNITFRNEGSFTRLQDSVLGAVCSDIAKNYLIVSKLDKKLSIIKADIKATNEVFAKVFNDQIVANVNDFYVQTKTKKSLENVAILQQKTDSVRAVMNGAIYTAAAVTDATPNLNPTRQVQRVAPVQRSQFTAETNKAVLVELLKNLEMSKIALRKETPLIQVVDEPIFPLYKEKFGKLKGIVVGGFIFGFLTVLFLILKLMFKNTSPNE